MVTLKLVGEFRKDWLVSLVPVCVYVSIVSKSIFLNYVITFPLRFIGYI